jgi:hypothetical protein
MQQRERFAVACLASVLKHDLLFREAFLRAVCDWQGPGNIQDFEVWLEIDGCGDLALEAKKFRIVFVVECKIDAPLQENQWPKLEARNGGAFLLEEATATVS